MHSVYYLPSMVAWGSLGSPRRLLMSSYRICDSGVGCCHCQEDYSGPAHTYVDFLQLESLRAPEILLFLICFGLERAKLNSDSVKLWRPFFPSRTGRTT